ncbi:MAG: M23 family metallopeptidase [Spirochaetales bacterium]|nr:M23 family metallopeptidase [Spirochaetales bacterium]
MAEQPVLKSNIIRRIISASEQWLGKDRSFSSPLIDFKSEEITAQFFIVVNRVSSTNLHIQEIIVSTDGVNHVFRNWTFIKDGEWQVLSLEKEGRHVVLVDLSNEIAELSASVDTVYEKHGTLNLYFEEEKLAIDYNEAYSGYVKPKGPILKFFSVVYNEIILHPSVFVPVSSLAIIILAVLVSSYFIKVNKIQSDLGSSMDDYLVQLQSHVKDLDSFKVEAEGDLDVLKKNLEKSQSDFEFNRRNAYVNVTRLGEELTRHLPARKEAYKLIASNIKEAVSYGEIIYEMSNLPSEEYQARIFLATDEQRVIPLSRWIPVFDDMAYPVEIEGRPNDGRGFRITSGFSDSREDPFVPGRVVPHYAVDIINVGNIDYISYAGRIVREGMPSGDVVCTYDGVVMDVQNEGHYGNTIEIKHALTEQVKKVYPNATYWTSFYAHLKEPPLKKADEWVNKAEKIGFIGNTGRSTGPHLHFEVRVYNPKGHYWTVDGERFDKVNPFPFDKKKVESSTKVEK